MSRQRTAAGFVILALPMLGCEEPPGTIVGLQVADLDLSLAREGDILRGEGSFVLELATPPGSQAQRSIVLHGAAVRDLGVPALVTLSGFENTFPDAIGPGEAIDVPLGLTVDAELAPVDDLTRFCRVGLSVEPFMLDVHVLEDVGNKTIPVTASAVIDSSMLAIEPQVPPDLPLVDNVWHNGELSGGLHSIAVGPGGGAVLGESMAEQQAARLTLHSAADGSVTWSRTLPVRDIVIGASEGGIAVVAEDPEGVSFDWGEPPPTGPSIVIAQLDPEGQARFAQRFAVDGSWYKSVGVGHGGEMTVVLRSLEGRLTVGTETFGGGDPLTVVLAMDSTGAIVERHVIAGTFANGMAIDPVTGAAAVWGQSFAAGALQIGEHAVTVPHDSRGWLAAFEATGHVRWAMDVPAVGDAVFTPSGSLALLEGKEAVRRNAGTGAIESARPLGESEPTAVVNTSDGLLLAGTFHAGATFPTASLDYDGPAPLRYLWWLPEAGAESIEILGCEGSLAAASGGGALYVVGETRAGALLEPQALLESDAAFIARLE